MSEREREKCIGMSQVERMRERERERCEHVMHREQKITDTFYFAGNKEGSC